MSALNLRSNGPIVDNILASTMQLYRVQSATHVQAYTKSFLASRVRIIECGSHDRAIDSPLHESGMAAFYIQAAPRDTWIHKGQGRINQYANCAMAWGPRFRGPPRRQKNLDRGGCWRPPPAPRLRGADICGVNFWGGKQKKKRSSPPVLRLHPPSINPGKYPGRGHRDPLAWGPQCLNPGLTSG
jgi:hypothetical protein